jgi:hypothetical protein
VKNSDFTPSLFTTAVECGSFFSHLFQQLFQQTLLAAVWARVVAGPAYQWSFGSACRRIIWTDLGQIWI